MGGRRTGPYRRVGGSASGSYGIVGNSAASARNGKPMTTLGAIAMSVMRLGPRAPGRAMARVGASTAKATAMSHRYPSEGLGRKMRRDVVSFAVIAPASLTDYAREEPAASTLGTTA